MPNTNQTADILFKKLYGLGTTSSGRAFFEEPIRGRSFIELSQIWAQSDLIPLVAPTISSGVVQRLIDYSLTQVAGAPNAFTGQFFKDIIPFNYGDGVSYNYVVKNNINQSIPFGQNDWTIDTEAGVLLFNGGAPTNMPPQVSFWRYTGAKGFDTIQDLIDANSNGVTTLNSLTGSINLVGNGGLQIYLSGNNIVISGSEGTVTTQILTDVSGVLQAQITNINNETGKFYLNTNPSGYIDIAPVVALSGYLGNELTTVVRTTGNQTINGNKIFLGDVSFENITVNGTQTIINTEVVNVSSNYLNLNATGGARDAGIFINTGNNIGGIIGFDVPQGKWVIGTGVSGATNFDALQFIATEDFVAIVSGILNNTINASGSYLYSLSTGISGYLLEQILVSNNGVALLNGLSGVVNIVGQSGIQILTQGQNIVVNTTGLAFLSELQNLDLDLQTQITAINELTGFFLHTSGIQSFTYSVPGGVDSAMITFPFSFVSRPSVTTSVEVTNSNNMYIHTLNNITNNGFTVNFSDNIQENPTGVLLNVIAKI